MWHISWSIGYFEVQRNIMQITDRYVLVLTLRRAFMLLQLQYFVTFMVTEKYKYKQTEKM